MNFVDFNRHVIASSEELWPYGRPRSLTQRLVLFVVCTGAPRTPSDIARATGLRRPSVTAAVRELERLQLVSSVASMHDGRSVHVHAHPWVQELIAEMVA